MTNVRPFHEVVTSRIKSLDIMNFNSIAQAARIKEDVTHIKIPANKIIGIGNDVQTKMTEVAGADSAYVEQVHHELSQAHLGIESQIAAYRANGDLTDDQADAATRSIVEHDGGQFGLDLDPALADQSLKSGKMNGAADPLGR